MTHDTLISKLDILWNDTQRSLRIGSFIALLAIWFLVGLILMLSRFNYLPPVPDSLVILWKVATTFLLIMAHTFFIGARYLQDIHEVPHIKYMWRYLAAVIFAVRVPKLKIVGGKAETKDEFSFIEHIGGPGVVEIGRDNAVALETLLTQKDILRAGQRHIARFDYVRDIVSTEEQYGKIDELKTLTADGIQVVIQNIQFRFRVDGGYKPVQPNSKLKDYVPMKKAVMNLLYSRPVDVEGKSAPWMNAVSGMVSGIIRDHVNKSYLDELIAPRDKDEHSLDTLRLQFTQTHILDRFKGMGVKLLACNIGELGVTSIDLDKERLRAWYSKQAGAIQVIRAQGDAERFASRERGRTEGQALLVKSIGSALQDLKMQQNGKDSLKSNLRKILLTRTAQILEARTSVYHTRKEEQQ